jgi:predicted membrane protein
METNNRLHDHNACGSTGTSFIRRLLAGIFVISAGLILLGVNLGYLPEIVKEYVISWQALLIALGIINLFGRKSGFWFSAILIFIGSLFLFAKFNDMPVEWNLILWPVVLVFIGLGILSKIGSAKNWNKKLKKHSVDADFLDDTNIFGGSKVIVTSKQFKGGEVNNIFGGSEIDFTHAELQEGDTEIEISCIFGGVKFIFPADWNLVLEVDGILGGMSDKRQIVTDKYIDYSKRLIIKGSCIFGGGEIESVVRR